MNISNQASDQDLTAAAERAGSELFRKALQALPSHVAVLNSRGVVVLVNHAWSSFGAANGATCDADVGVGANYLDLCRSASTKDDDALTALTGIEAVLAGRMPIFNLEYPCHSPVEQRWFLMTVTPLDPDELAGAVVSHLDITDRVVAQAERSASEARFRAIYENAPVGIAELCAGGRWLRVNDRFSRILGYDVRDLQGKLASDFCHEDDIETEGAHFEVLRAGDAAFFAFEKRMRRKDGAFLWVHATTSCVRDDKGAIDYFVAVIEDISERKLAEQRQQTLTHELAHRGKNLLAVVQSVANRTFSTSATLEDAREAFEGRLDALSRTYSTLTQEAFSGARLDAILSEEFAAFGGRVHLDGPSVMLTVKAAQTFGLIAHELGTNAVKYGALSTQDGRLSVAWSVRHGDDGDRLRFDWREDGGPPVKTPTRSGFGSSLVTRVAGAEFQCKPELRYEEAGVRYGFDAPLSKLGALQSDTPLRRKLKSEIARTLYDAWAKQRGRRRLAETRRLRLEEIRGHRRADDFSHA